MGCSFLHLLVTFLCQSRGCLCSDSENITTFSFPKRTLGMVFRALKLHSQVRLKRPRGANRSSPHLSSLLQLEPLWLVPLVFKGWVFKRRQLYDSFNLCIVEQRKRRLRE